MKFEFDKKKYNWGYAFYFSVIQCVLILGFAVALALVVLNATLSTSVTIPDFLLPFVAIYLLVSIIGFPLVSIAKIGFRKLIRSSSLDEIDECLVYDRIADRLWTFVGHVTEHHIYRVNEIKSISHTKRFLVIQGVIEKK